MPLSLAVSQHGRAVEDAISEINTIGIIGGGLSGLAAGVALSRHGFRVKLFEANEKIGDCYATTQLRGFTFNDGAMYVAVPEILDKAFEKLGLDRRSAVPLRRIVAKQIEQAWPIDRWTEETWEELADVILCGHSYSGMMISGVADRVPEKLRSLVYLDAFVPEDGTCLIDYVAPERAARFRHDAQTKGGGGRLTPIPAETFNVNPEDRAWVDRQCVEHPLKCFEQKLRLI
jgi:pimeloyl-ACP methyl ester carboxylesterase